MRENRTPLTPAQAGLAAANRGLAYAALARLRPGGLIDALDPDEAESVALYALVKAARGYDPARGVRFSSYAMRAIRNDLLLADREARARRCLRRGLAAARREPARAGAPPTARLEAAEALAALPAREALVLRLRFGVGEERPASIPELSARLALTRNQLYWLTRRGLAWLREG